MQYFTKFIRWYVNPKTYFLNHIPVHVKYFKKHVSWEKPVQFLISRQPCIPHLADLCGLMVEFPVNTNLQLKESSLWVGNRWFYVF